MKVFVLLRGERHEVQVAPSDSVAQLRNVIHARLSVAPANQRLFCSGRELRDSNVTTGKSLTLLDNLVGVPPRSGEPLLISLLPCADPHSSHVSATPPALPSQQSSGSSAATAAASDLSPPKPSLKRPSATSPDAPSVKRGSLCYGPTDDLALLLRATLAERGGRAPMDALMSAVRPYYLGVRALRTPFYSNVGTIYSIVPAYLKRLGALKNSDDEYELPADAEAPAPEAVALVKEEAMRQLVRRLQSGELSGEERASAMEAVRSHGTAADLEAVTKSEAQAETPQRVRKFIGDGSEDEESEEEEEDAKQLRKSNGNAADDSSSESDDDERPKTRDRDQDMAVVLRSVFAKSPNPTMEELHAEVLPLYFGLRNARNRLFSSVALMHTNIRNYLAAIGASEKDGRWSLADDEPPSEAQVRSVRKAALARLSANPKLLQKTSPSAKESARSGHHLSREASNDLAVLLADALARHGSASMKLLIHEVEPFYLGLRGANGRQYSKMHTLAHSIRGYLDFFGARKSNGRWSLPPSVPRPSEEEVQQVKAQARQAQASHKRGSEALAEESDSTSSSSEDEVASKAPLSKSQSELAILLRGLLAEHPSGLTLNEIRSEITPIFCGLISLKGKQFKTTNGINATLLLYLRQLCAVESSGKWVLREEEPPSERQVREVRERAMQRLGEGQPASQSPELVSHESDDETQPDGSVRKLIVEHLNAHAARGVLMEDLIEAMQPHSPAAVRRILHSVATMDATARWRRRSEAGSAVKSEPRESPPKHPKLDLLASPPKRALSLPLPSDHKAKRAKPSPLPVGSPPPILPPQYSLNLGDSEPTDTTAPYAPRAWRHNGHLCLAFHKVAGVKTTVSVSTDGLTITVKFDYPEITPKDVHVHGDYLSAARPGYSQSVAYKVPLGARVQPPGVWVPVPNPSLAVYRLRTLGDDADQHVSEPVQW